MSIFNENDRKVAKLRKLATKVDELAPKYKNMSDKQLQAVTDELRKRYKEDEDLDEILIDAYAAVREAAERVLGMRPFFVQIMGAIALHQGRIAEMGTGEGKTLVATMPSYLNAIAGKGVHVVTVNDYLAERDAAWMGKVHRFMGLTVGVVVPEMKPEDKRKAYNCDITYCTNNELGFDYLRDNMVVSKADKVQRELNFAIVDEVDSILIDEARTPLIISGRGGKSGEIYKTADSFAKTLHGDGAYKKANEFVKTLESRDYAVNEKQQSVVLTDSGKLEMEGFFSEVKRTASYSDLNRQIQLALKARYMLKKGKDYIVDEYGKVCGLDASGDSTDRPYSHDDLQQAIEAKENVDITNIDFTIEEKERTIMLTEVGVAKAERYFKVDNLMESEGDDGNRGKYTELYHHIQQALKAHNMMSRDRDYIVQDGEVLIVDEFTGRVMIGRRYSDGLHQAIEAKEGIRVKSENKTLATITFQNFFRMYKKLSGMTGTAKTEEEEFEGIYYLDVVAIPPNKVCQRKDDKDQIYNKVQAKNKAIVEDIVASYKKGQPVLVGTVSVEKSEELSKILGGKGIRHNVLNAKLHKQEAEIIAQAGRPKAVTIATNMAGRGTDIVLGGNPEFMAKQRMEKEGFPLDVIEMATSPHVYDDPMVKEAKQSYLHHFNAFKKDCDEERKKVIEAGGLKVIGTERHESRRIDNQLRGRSGRQGDPGATIFYISLEDDVARIFGGDRIKPYIDRVAIEEDKPIPIPFIAKQIERAQKAVENRHYSIRKQVLNFDDVMNKQRELMYKERGKVLDGMDVHDEIVEMIGTLAEDIIEKHADYKTDYKEWDYKAFNDALEHKMLPQGTNLMDEKLCSCFDVYKLKEAVLEIALKNYNEKVEKEELTLKLKKVEKVDDSAHSDGELEGSGIRGQGLGITEELHSEQSDLQLHTNPTTDSLYTGIIQAEEKTDAAVAEEKVDNTKEKTEKTKEEEVVRTINLFKELERRYLLRIVDRKWMDHIDAMDALRSGISLRGYGQQDPVVAYRKEGWDMFESMVHDIHCETAHILLKLEKREDKKKDIVITQNARVGRNEQCPCGSGRKYKNCCGK